MADSGSSGIRGAVEEISQAAGEVVSDVKDSVGELIEQGIQSVASTPLTPQQVRQQQQQDQIQIAEARRKIKWQQDLALAQQRVREEEKQKIAQKQEVDQANKANQNKNISGPVTKPAAEREDLARTKFEKSKGGGVGG